MLWLVGRPRAIRCVLLVAALWAGACASPLPPPPAPLYPGYRYVNPRIGVALSLPAEWKAFAKRSEAPPGFEAMMPASKGRDESPLLVGLAPDGQSYLRLLVEPVPPSLSLEAYVRLLVAATRAEAEPLSASLSPERGAARFAFRARQGPLELLFRESIVLANGRAIRLGFWSLAAFAGRYDADFAAIEADVLFHRDGAWQAPLDDLEASLDPSAFADLEYAQDGPPSGAPACAEGEHPGFWRVSSERGTLFLFGSVHFGHPDFYPFPAPIEEAFAASETLVVEVDAKALGEQRAALREIGALPAGRRLGDEISGELYARLAEVLEEMSLSVENFSQAAPWSLSLMLTEIAFNTLGYTAASGVDNYFLDRAGEREIVALETADEQIAMLRQLDGAASLSGAIDFLDSVEANGPRMMKAWRCGDDAALARVILGPEPGPAAAGSFRERMFSARNRLMAERLEPLLARGDVFVVVGAGHLLGEDGIPALLAARGHRVERH
jgi:uncharacterized protein YbaP (TraB family)